MRTCKACEQEFPDEDFAVKDPRTGRLDTTCRPCRRASGRSHYAENAEAVKSVVRSYRERNIDEIRARDRVRTAERREREPEIVRERIRDWCRRNRDAKRDQAARWRARARGAQVVETIDRAAIIERDRRICHLCGKRVPDGPRELHLDHIVPLSKGGDHTARNLAVAHAKCNQRRGAGLLPAQLRLIG